MEKTDLGDLSVIFSIKIDSVDRLNNLKFNLELFRTFFKNYEVVIVEQDVKSRIADELPAEKGIKHYVVLSPDVHYKTRNLNYATHLSTREIIMMCDCDVFCPPHTMCKALNELRRGAAFLSPHNGIMVELKKSFVKEINDVKALMRALIHFPKNFDLNLQNFDFGKMAPIYGSSSYDSTGGCIFYRKNQFYLIGGWNTNFVSYGYEDMEFVYRIRKLGYELKMLPDANIYHLEHMRGEDSMYNNFYRSNEAEWFNVNMMTQPELLSYALNGFRKIDFHGARELSIVNTRDKYCIETIENDKIDLTDLCIVVPLCMPNRQFLVCLNYFVHYLELHFMNYEVVIAESQFRNGKYLSSKKHIKYIWSGPGESGRERSIAEGCANTLREYVAVWDYFSMIDPAVLERAFQVLKRDVQPMLLNDDSWYLPGVTKMRRGSGVTLFKQPR